MDRPVRVLVLTKSLDLGGAERLIVSMAAVRDRAAFQYDVAYVLSTADGLVTELRATGVGVHCLGARNSYDLRWVLRMRHLLHRGRYDILHTHMPYASAFGRLVAHSLPRELRPRLVSTAHIDVDRLAWPTQLLERATYCLDDRVIAASSATRATLPARVRARAETIVHGIDLDQAARCGDRAPQVRASLPGDTSDALIVTVANLRRQKNYPMFLRAIRLLTDCGMPVQVLAVGDGPLRRELEAMRDRLGLCDRVHFLGYRSDAVAVVAAADVFVLTSDYEAATLAVVEAMRVGTPVAVTAVGELPQIVTTA